MRTWVLLFGVLAIAVAISEAAPQQRQSSNRSPNPNVNLITQGLIDKLCKRDERIRNGGSATGAANTRGRKTRQAVRNGKGTTPAPAGPSCSTYNNYTFEQLIAENRKLLRPVNRRERSRN